MYAATPMHHSVDHPITHESVDQATHTTTGCSKSIGTPALLQLICAWRRVIKHGHIATLRFRLATP